MKKEESFKKSKKIQPANKELSLAEKNLKRLRSKRQRYFDLSKGLSR